MSDPLENDISDEAALRIGEDPVIRHLMKNVDRNAIRENLKLTHEQRLLKFEKMMRDLESREQRPQQPLELKEVPDALELRESNNIAETSLGSVEPHRNWFPIDPVVEAYKKDVDRTLLRETLKLTPAERALQLEAMTEFIEELRAAGVRMRAEHNP
jgi:hypothetical protein